MMVITVAKAKTSFCYLGEYSMEAGFDGARQVHRFSTEKERHSLKSIKECQYTVLNSNSGT